MKLAELGLDGKTSSSSSFFIFALTPSSSPEINTLRLLSLDSDYANTSNYLFPYFGRQVAIDGERGYT